MRRDPCVGDQIVHCIGGVNPSILQLQQQIYE